MEVEPGPPDVAVPVSPVGVPGITVTTLWETWLSAVELGPPDTTVLNPPPVCPGPPEPPPLASPPIPPGDTITVLNTEPRVLTTTVCVVLGGPPPVRTLVAPPVPPEFTMTVWVEKTDVDVKGPAFVIAGPPAEPPLPPPEPAV